MSVIVYDSSAQMMAADSRAYSGCSHPSGYKMKIHRITEGPFVGSLLGISSAMVGAGEEFRQWISDGMPKDYAGFSTCDWEAILVNPKGEVYLFVDGYCPSGPLVGEVFSIGTGKKYAHGAWLVSRDALKAVEIAIACDNMSGGPVTSLYLEYRVQESSVLVSEAVEGACDA